VPWRFSAAGRLSAWIDLHSGSRKPPQHRKSPFSFDHLIGATEQHRWHFEAERFSSLEVDYEIELLRPLYR
jgi:hypothetical protein